MFRLNLDGKFEQDKGQTIKRRPRPSKNPEISSALGDIYQIINNLSNAVNQGFTQIYKDDASGKEGDIRCVSGTKGDDSYSLEAKTSHGWIRSSGKVDKFDPPYIPWSATCAYTGAGLQDLDGVADAINEQVNALREEMNLLFWKVNAIIDETGYIVKERRTDRYDRQQPIVTRLIPPTPASGGDTSAPSILELAPANGATDVALDAVLELTADETIYPPTMGAKKIYIKEQGLNWPSSTISYDEEENTQGRPWVSFNGAVLTIEGALDDLEPGTTYWVHIPGQASNGITDEAGNSLPEIDAEGENNWIFTTLSDS